MFINKWSVFGLCTGDAISHLLFKTTEYDRYYNVYFKIVEKILFIAQDVGKAEFQILVSWAKFLFSSYFLSVTSSTLNKETLFLKL